MRYLPVTGLIVLIILYFRSWVEHIHAEGFSVSEFLCYAIFLFGGAYLLDKLAKNKENNK